MKKYLCIIITLLLLLCGCGEVDLVEETVAAELSEDSEAKEEAESSDIKRISTDRKAKEINDENCISIKSLNDTLVFNIYHNNDELVYDLEKTDKTPIINESKLGMKTSNLPNGFGNAEIVSAATQDRNFEYDFIGGFNKIADICKTAVINLKTDDYEYSMEVKMYDNGVAFRYVLPAYGKEQTITYEDTSFAVDNLDCLYCGSDSFKYQSDIMKRSFNSLLAFKLNGPITIVTKDEHYVVLLEGYVDPSCIGTYYKAGGEKNTFIVESSWTNDVGYDAFTTKEDVYTPWKLINYSDDIKGIVDNTNIYSSATCLNDEIVYDYDYSYVESVRSAFSYINNERSLDDMYDYTVALARLGFEYNTIDAIYTKWTEQEIKDLCDFSKKNNVKQMIWAHMDPEKTERYPYYFGDVASAKANVNRLKKLGIDGIKVDYIHDESYYGEFEIEKQILLEAAKNQMVISFHNSHKPVGYSVLYPNYVNCEGIKGLQGFDDDRYNFKPIASATVNQFFTRCLSGMADFTPDAYNMMEVASWIVIDAPFKTITTSPFTLLEDRAVEIMKAIPASWDNTVFLGGALDSYVSIAREKDNRWFVGGVYSEKTQDVTVDLSFLDDGTYMMTCYKDTDVINMEREKILGEVTKDDIIELGEIKAGGGYAIMLTKLDICRHGGEIGDINVTRADENSIVKYTLDGTDPFTSETAKECGDSITIEDTSVLTIAITDGEGKGTKMKYNFNRIYERNN